MSRTRWQKLYRRYDNAHRVMWFAGRKSEAQRLTDRFLAWLTNQMPIEE